MVGHSPSHYRSVSPLTTTNARIDGSDLLFRYQDKVLFHINRLAFIQGDSILLSGANGAGKTTLMKILAGLLTPQFGRVKASGFASAKWLKWPNFLSSKSSAVLGKAAYLHQSPYLYSGTVKANLTIATPPMQRLSKAYKIRLEQAIEQARLGPLLTQDAAQLSGGEKQRLALARVFLVQPPLLMLDEPTANMDQASQQLVYTMIKQLHHQGVGIMVVSHQSNKVTQLCQQHWLLADKQLTICGRPREVSDGTSVVQQQHADNRTQRYD
ncbi:energy-coupling factor ABC transporter ATP-binding protein [Thalassotalea ponticola]|uniref:energy-coupling factor ABC transporter ATP-binding protein n=1 Tax=Thalassotalea ponticola TaxID=1523392 RepID=UPI0025B5B491|nr:energy-coupling factor ABC transporter ATP-binding protein [Thalassotalea ponticola]MDN3653973.1 energy-coupling factor ABC transporter ATP-binding protein [Thalassotalea ponticola]